MRTFRIGSHRVLLLALLAVLLGAISPAALLASSAPVEHPLLAVQAPPQNGCSNYGMPYGQSSNPYSRMPGYGNSYYGGYMPCRMTYPRAYYPPASYPPSSYPTRCVRAVYIVRPGDNLFRIGLKYGVSWVTLAAFNGIRNANYIFWGMRLAIPCSGGYAPGMSQGYPSSGYPSNNPPSYPPPQKAPKPQPGGSGQTTVGIMDFNFNPATITVKVGQTVTWMNYGPSMHTTTSDAGAWESDALNAGQSFSHTFPTAGTFPYHCEIHPSMQGTVVVTQ